MNDKDFEDVFPHENMRDVQKEGIPETYEGVKNKKWTLLEGATGTGKTIIAISSLLKLLEESNKYERIFIMTNVKQQQEIFEEEIKLINKKTNYNINSITLKGKNELCTFVDSGEIGEREIYSKCDELRKGTSQLKEIEGSYDNIIQKSPRGKEYPFDDTNIPSYLDTQYCPFYANSLKRSKEDALFEKNFNGQLTTENILEESSQKGLCPHATAGRLMEEVDIIIGNYSHVIDKKTVENYTSEIIDGSTLLVVDEAHNIIRKSRESLSKESSLNDIKQGIKEILSMEMFLKLPQIDSNLDNEKLKRIEKRAIISFGSVNELQKNSEDLRGIIERSDYTIGDLSKSKEFLKSLLEVSEELIEESNKEKVPLRDPQKIENDKISEWISLYFSQKETNLSKIVEQKQVLLKLLTQSYMNSSNVGRIPSAFYLEKVFNLLETWNKSSQKNYYRSIERNKENEDYSKLKLYNLVPREQLSDRLNEFGGGVLMSATLEPIDLFSEEVGLSDKNTKKISYGLNFPKENRLSLNINLKKYTSSNRGRRDKNLQKNSKLRKKYVQTVKEIVRNAKGNTMIVMPSYKEADWMSSFLETDTKIDKKIIIDQSSGEKITKKKKKEFFGKQDSVMLTSARGTLTEGVDYKGDKLNNVVVVGIPILNTQDIYQQAILTSYQEEFSRYKGFQLAFMLPATRKSRQAIGRVIRSNNDKGTRILIDERYCEGGSVHDYLGKDKKDFKDVSEEDIEHIINSFWNK